MKNFKTRALAIVLAVAFVLAIAIVSVSAGASQSAWYRKAVEYLDGLGISAIGSDGDAPLSRDEFVMWAAKVESHQTITDAWDVQAYKDIASQKFSDVSESPYQGAIAYSLGRPLIEGYGDGTFKFIGTDTDASKHEIDANTAYFGDAEGQLKFDFRYKTGGKSGSKNAISLTIPAKGKVLVYARTGSNSATDRNVVLTQNGATLIDHILLESEAQTVVIESAKSDENPTGEKAVYPVLEANVVAGTVDVTYPVNSVNFYGFQFVPEGATPITGISTVTTSTKANANAPIYNLAGQQVNKNYKGVVIQNGVKRIQK